MGFSRDENEGSLNVVIAMEHWVEEAHKHITAYYESLTPEQQLCEPDVRISLIQNATIHAKMAIEELKSYRVLGSPDIIKAQISQPSGGIKSD